MYRLPRFSRRVIASRLTGASAALVLGLGLSAAAVAQPTSQSGLAERLDRVAERLDLSSTQRGQLDALVARTPDPSDADLWYVTADVHALLTPEQRAALTEGNPQAESTRGLRGRGAARAHHQRAHRSETTRPHREAERAERERLREQHQSGALSDDAYRDAVRALRERTRDQARTDASPEQQAEMDAHAARRQAVKAARERVLGLTAAQKERFEDARLKYAARRDRSAASPESGAPRDLLLTERQQELLAVHRVLAGRSGPAHRRGGPGRRG